jgi:metallothionein
MTTVTEIKCACPTCSCTVSLEQAIQRDSKYFCSEGCAEGHKTIKGCTNKACGC